MAIISHAPPRVNNNGGIIMTAKQELIAFIAALTPAQVEKLWQHRDELESKLSAAIGRPITLNTQKEA